MTIFNYNTCISFGFGAEHLSVKVSSDNSKIEFYTGSPMEPVISDILEYSDEIIDDISDKKSYLNDREVAIYIKGQYLNN